jgi:hypothetical protein
MTALALSTPAGIFGQQVVAQAAANGDLDILNFGFALETVAIEAYKTAAGTNLLPKPVLDIGLKFASQHTDHRAALGAAIKQISGKDAVPPAGPFNFPVLKSVDDILNFAKTLEEAAVGTYYGSLGKFQSPQLQAAAVSIVGVESEHVAVLAAALKQNPIPNAFVTGTPFDQVQKTATSLLSTSGAGGGQGGGTNQPSGAPATGLGGSAASKPNDFTGAVLGVLGTVSVAAAAALALNKKKSAEDSAEDNKAE